MHLRDEVLLMSFYLDEIELYLKTKLETRLRKYGVSDEFSKKLY